MPFEITTSVTCYLLPQDGEEAKAVFFKNLLDPGETWIIAYSFTLPDMLHELLAAHQKGLPVHIYLDRSQEVGRTEMPLVEQLASASGLAQAYKQSRKKGEAAVSCAGLIQAVQGSL